MRSDMAGVDYLTCNGTHAIGQSLTIQPAGTAIVLTTFTGRQRSEFGSRRIRLSGRRQMTCLRESSSHASPSSLVPGLSQGGTA
jgi:hypothetical protein